MDSQFSSCVSTSIQDDLLEALIANKLRKYPLLNPVTSGGHTRSDEARHLLTYVLASALGIHRKPCCVDLVLNPKIFYKYSSSSLEGAVADARRIYEHGQQQMALVSSTMRLRRGLREPESSVAYTLAKRTDFPINLPFQTFAFFNHMKSPFRGEATLELDAPIKWVWASEYTLSDLKISSTDEEVIVVVDSLDGCVPIAQSQLKFQSNAKEIMITDRDNVARECLGHLFCGERVGRSVAIKYTEGRFESIGRKIDHMLQRSGKATLIKNSDVMW